MADVRRYAAGLLTTAALATGVVAATPTAAQADPQSVKCADTMPTHVIHSSFLRKRWVGPATHVATTYNEDNQPSNCQYEGRLYVENRLTGNVRDLGPYRYWKLKLVPIVWG